MKYAFKFDESIRKLRRIARSMQPKPILRFYDRYLLMKLENE